MPGRISGKVAVITGGASGIGLGIARRFVNEGARVMLGDVNGERLAAAASELGDSCATCVSDVTSEADVEALMTATVDAFGRVDIGVNCAGTGAFSPVVDQSTDDWDRLMAVNLRGVMLSIKHQARQMIAAGEGGSIMSIASLNAVQPAEGMGLYCATKAGVAMYTRCAAMELGPRGIRVNAIGPGLVDTPLAALLHQVPAVHAEFVANAPLGRGGTPADVAGVALFLASDDSSWITGEMVMVDGGAQNKRYPELFKLFAAGL